MERSLTKAGRCTSARLTRFMVGNKDLCKADYKALNIFFVLGSQKILASPDFDDLVDGKQSQIGADKFKIIDNIAYKP